MCFSIILEIGEKNKERKGMERKQIQCRSSSLLSLRDETLTVTKILFTKGKPTKMTKIVKSKSQYQSVLQPIL